MAHTDKTDPFWVNMATGYFKSEAVHDHTEVPCDLPPLREYGVERWGWHPRSTSCYWSFVYDNRNVCCCQMCRGWAGQYGEYSARRDRHETNVANRRLAAEFNTYGDIEEW